MRLTVVGSGRAASALTPRWVAAGFEVTSWSRSDGAPEAMPAAEVVVLAVPDAVVADLARGLAAREAARAEVWVHLSGVHAASVLRVAPDVPRAVACMHPLVALGPGVDPSGAVAGVEGEPAALPIAESLARAAGLVPHAIPADRALYHAAAVSVAGHATALFAQAMTLLEGAGFARDDARAALQPLLLSAAKNLARGAPEAVITGPVSRGDAATIARHLAALAPFDADVRAVYRALGRQALALSAATLTPETRAALSRLLAEPEAGS